MAPRSLVVPLVPDAPRAVQVEAAHPEAPAFLGSRSVKLAACAVAVLGVVSGAALLTPGPTLTAQADNLGHPVTAPIDTASSTSGATDGGTTATHRHGAPTRAVRRTHHAAAHSLPSRRAATHAAQPTSARASSAAPAGATTPPSAGTTTPGPIRTGSPTPALPTTGLDLHSIIARAATSSLLSLNEGTYVLHDFDAQLMGANLGTDGVRGAGVDKTVIEMAPHSSTKAGSVPTAAYSTNQLYLLSTIGGTPGLSGFTLRATDQGHLYNGLRIGHATNARISDVKVQSVPGNNSFPPGETFVLNDWRTTGSVYDNVTIDGGGVSAAGFGVNSSSDITVNTSTFTGTAYSSGGAFWQSHNITLNSVRIVNNRSGLNFERDTGTITLNRPTFSGNRLYDMQMGSDQGGAQVVINDPVLAPGQKIRMNVPATYHGGSNNQLRSDIHVYVNGVDRTSQLVQFL